MKTSRVSSVGALHPILFFAVMYVVVLFLSIFICSSIFHSINGMASSQETQKPALVVEKQNFPISVSTAVVVR